MDSNKKALLKFVKSALTDEISKIEESFDIQTIYTLAYQHGITSLVYSGAFKCGVNLADDANFKVFDKVCRETVISEKQLFELGEIEKSFQENQIVYMPLKGATLKKVYSKAEYRTMSDIDILIKIDQYPQIEKIML